MQPLLLTGRQDVDASDSASCSAPQLDDQLTRHAGASDSTSCSGPQDKTYTVGVMVMMLAEWLPVITQDAHKMPKGVVPFLSALVLSANLVGSGTVPTHANYNLHACIHAILLYKCFKHHFDFSIKKAKWLLLMTGQWNYSWTQINKCSTYQKHSIYKSTVCIRFNFQKVHR